MSVRIEYVFACDFQGCASKSRVGYEQPAMDGADSLNMLPQGWELRVTTSAYFKVRCQEHAKP